MVSVQLGIVPPAVTARLEQLEIALAPSTESKYETVPVGCVPVTVGVKAAVKVAL